MLGAEAPGTRCEAVPFPTSGDWGSSTGDSVSKPAAVGWGSGSAVAAAVVADDAEELAAYARGRPKCFAVVAFGRCCCWVAVARRCLRFVASCLR